jgi:hypothetical protein
MAGKNTAVYGIYSNRQTAENAVDRLLASGFRNEDISVLLQDNVGTKDFAHQKDTKAPEGTTTGVVAGGAIGGTLGLLAGIGALAIPGLGPFIAAGPIMATLAGIGSGGVLGGIVGALVGMGILRVVKENGIFRRLVDVDVVVFLIPNFQNIYVVAGRANGFVGKADLRHARAALDLRREVLEGVHLQAHAAHGDGKLVADGEETLAVFPGQSNS